MKRLFVPYWMPVLVWAAFIFTLSSISLFPRGVQPLLSLSSFWHSAVYLVLSFLLARAWRHSLAGSPLRFFRLFAIVCAILYGISDEYHQSFIPLRVPSAIDVMYDSIGALIGAFLYRDRS